MLQRPKREGPCVLGQRKKKLRLTFTHTIIKLKGCFKEGSEFNLSSYMEGEGGSGRKSNGTQITHLPNLGQWPGPLTSHAE